MALLERVSTLLRANVNDLIDRAENPEKMLRQLLLDMENQLLQVKTQVAIAIADQHLLEKKKQEHDDAAAAWQRKAELAVTKREDDLARAALDRSLTHQQLSEGFAQQIDDQRMEAETMRGSYARLQHKLRETEARSELLLAQNRRARRAGKIAKVQTSGVSGKLDRSMHKMRMKVLGDEAANEASQLMLEADMQGSMEERFRKLEREDRIEVLLKQLKAGN